MRRIDTRTLLTVALGALVVAGCGSSTPSKPDQRFYSTVQQKCAQALGGVQGAADATKTNAPRDDVLAKAAVALHNASVAVADVSAPADQRQAQHGVAAELQTASATVSHYLQDQQSNVSQTSADYNGIIEHFSELQQFSARYALPACAIPVQ